MTPLSCTREDITEFAVVTVSGDIDLESAPRVRQAIADAISAGRNRVVLDLTGVTFLDSIGLGVAVGGLRRARMADGTLWLVIHPSNAMVRALFHSTHLDRVFRIYDSVAQARASVR